MSLKKSLLAILFLVALFPLTSCAQGNKNYVRNGYTLIFKEDQKISPSLKTRMVNTYFIVYPKLVNAFNPNAVKTVTFSVDSTYKGVAATFGGAIIKYDPEWLKKHPEDIDVVTHELMHVVQAYGNTNGPWWLTEGIADYVRYTFGVDNKGAGWTLPELKNDHSYKSSYRITARFLAWLENHGYPGLVKKLDKKMREHAYSDNLWEEYTGKAIDSLWTEYTKNPNL